MCGLIKRMNHLCRFAMGSEAVCEASIGSLRRTWHVRGTFIPLLRMGELHEVLKSGKGTALLEGSSESVGDGESR